MIQYGKCCGVYAALWTTRDCHDGENVTRSGLMYRSGELCVTQLGVRLYFVLFSVRKRFLRTGKGQLRALGITTIFDIRSDTEIAKYDTVTPQIVGITVLHAPVFAKEDYSPEHMAQ